MAGPLLDSAAAGSSGSVTSFALPELNTAGDEILLVAFVGKRPKDAIGYPGGWSERESIVSTLLGLGEKRWSMAQRYVATEDRPYADVLTTSPAAGWAAAQIAVLAASPTQPTNGGSAYFRWGWDENAVDEPTLDVTLDEGAPDTGNVLLAWIAPSGGTPGTGFEPAFPEGYTLPDGWQELVRTQGPNVSEGVVAWKEVDGTGDEGPTLTFGTLRHGVQALTIVIGEFSIDVDPPAPPVTPVGWDVYAAADPNGAILATLDDAEDRLFRIERDGTGSGRFKINRSSPNATADVIAKGNIVKVRIPEIGPDYVFAFILEQGDFDLLSTDEEGGQVLEFGGRGILAYLDRAIMWSEAYSTGLDISDTWTKIWQTSKIPNPVGSCTINDDPTYLYVISGTTRKVYKLRQSDRVVVATSPALWAGSTNYAGGLCEDPADPTIMWALESPWAFGGGGNTKIRKVRISDWAILATFNLGSAVQLTDIEADSSNLWTSKYDGPDFQKRSKATGAVVTSYSITYAGVAQVQCTGLSINGSQVAIWFSGKKRALISDLSDPETITDVIKTTGISAFGGSWRTEGGQDYFYPVSYTADVVWKYQITSATPHDPIDGIWRLDEATAGAILWRLMQEWQHGSRPQAPLPDVTYAFTSTDDSDGNDWTTHDGTTEFDARVGEKGTSVVLRLPPYGLVVQMSPLLELEAFNSFGTNRANATYASGKVRFVGGDNIAESLKRRLDSREVDSDLLAQGEGSLFATADDHDFGYTVEGFLATQLKDATALAGSAEAELERQRDVAEAVAFEALWGPGGASGAQGYIPGPAGSNGHYWIGDTVRLHTGSGPTDYNEQNLLVYAITVQETEAGEWKAFPELSSELLVGPNGTGSSGGGGGSVNSSGGGSVGSGGSGGSGGGLEAITVVDSESGDEASGSTIEIDAGVTQAGDGRIGVVPRTPELDALRNVEAGEKADGDSLVWDEDLDAWVPGAHVGEFLTRAGGEGHALEAIAISGDAVEIDWSVANRFDVTLTDDPDITFAGLPAFGSGAEIGVTFRQDATGGRAIASWPASVAWYNPATGLGDGDPPTIPTDPGATLFVQLATADGGVTVGGTYGSGSSSVAALDDLSDVTITTPSIYDHLGYDGSEWVNSPGIWRPQMDGSTGAVIVDGATGQAIMAFGPP